MVINTEFFPVDADAAKIVGRIPIDPRNMSQADRGRADGHSLERFQIVIAPVKAHLFRRAGVPQRSQARFAAAQLPL